MQADDILKKIEKKKYIDSLKQKYSKDEKSIFEWGHGINLDTESVQKRIFSKEELEENKRLQDTEEENLDVIDRR